MMLQYGCSSELNDLKGWFGFFEVELYEALIHSHRLSPTVDGGWRRAPLVFEEAERRIDAEARRSAAVDEAVTKKRFSCLKVDPPRRICISLSERHIWKIIFTWLIRQTVLTGTEVFILLSSKSRDCTEIKKSFLFCHCGIQLQPGEINFLFFFCD